MYAKAGPGSETEATEETEVAPVASVASVALRLEERSHRPHALGVCATGQEAELITQEFGHDFRVVPELPNQVRII